MKKQDRNSYGTVRMGYFSTLFLFPQIKPILIITVLHYDTAVSRSNVSQHNYNLFTKKSKLVLHIFLLHNIFL